VELDLVGLFYSFNPCGFIMLPSYVAYYLAAGEGEQPSMGSRIYRGSTVGAVVGLGFLVVFLVLGTVLSLLGAVLAQYIPWLGVVVSVVLLVLGISMLMGKTFYLSWRPDQLLAQVSQRQSRDSLGFYFFYGAMYALASVSCTIPLFLAVVVQAFSLSPLNGVVHFLAYGMGMLIMMMALSLTTAISKDAVTRLISPIMRWMPVVSGVVLVAAGAYLIYYFLNAGLL
jgi:cytochrome c biogenesis protein CcdA